MYAVTVVHCFERFRFEYEVIQYLERYGVYPIMGTGRRIVATIEEIKGKHIDLMTEAEFNQWERTHWRHQYDYKQEQVNESTTCAAI